MVGLFAFVYYLTRRDLFRQRIASVTQSKQPDRLKIIYFASGLSEISPRYRARIADRLDAFEDGMVDVVQRLGQGLTGIHWKNGQSRVANMASMASRWFPLY